MKIPKFKKELQQKGNEMMKILQRVFAFLYYLWLSSSSLLWTIFPFLMIIAIFWVLIAWFFFIITTLYYTQIMPLLSIEGKIEEISNQQIIWTIDNNNPISSLAINYIPEYSKFCLLTESISSKKYLTTEERTKFNTILNTPLQTKKDIISWWIAWVFAESILLKDSWFIDKIGNKYLLHWNLQDVSKNIEEYSKTFCWKNKSKTLQLAFLQSQLFLLNDVWYKYLFEKNIETIQAETEENKDKEENKQEENTLSDETNTDKKISEDNENKQEHEEIKDNEDIKNKQQDKKVSLFMKWLNNKKDKELKTLFSDWFFLKTTPNNEWVDRNNYVELFNSLSKIQTLKAFISWKYYITSQNVFENTYISDSTYEYMSVRNPFPYVWTIVNIKKYDKDNLFFEKFIGSVIDEQWNKDIKDIQQIDITKEAVQIWYRGNKPIIVYAYDPAKKNKFIEELKYAFWRTKKSYWDDYTEESYSLEFCLRNPIENKHSFAFTTKINWKEELITLPTTSRYKLCYELSNIYLKKDILSFKENSELKISWKDSLLGKSNEIHAKLKLIPYYNKWNWIITQQKEELSLFSTLKQISLENWRLKETTDNNFCYNYDYFREKEYQNYNHTYTLKNKNEASTYVLSWNEKLIKTPWIINFSEFEKEERCYSFDDLWTHIKKWNKKTTYLLPKTKANTYMFWEDYFSSLSKEFWIKVNQNIIYEWEQQWDENVKLFKEIKKWQKYDELLIFDFEEYKENIKNEIKELKKKWDNKYKNVFKHYLFEKEYKWLDTDIQKLSYSKTLETLKWNYIIPQERKDKYLQQFSTLEKDKQVLLNISLPTIDNINEHKKEVSIKEKKFEVVEEDKALYESIKEQSKLLNQDKTSVAKIWWTSYFLGKDTVCYFEKKGKEIISWLDKEEFVSTLNNEIKTIFSQTIKEEEKEKLLLSYYWIFINKYDILFSKEHKENWFTKEEWEKILSWSVSYWFDVCKVKNRTQEENNKKQAEIRENERISTELKQELLNIWWSNWINSILEPLILDIPEIEEEFLNYKHIQINPILNIFKQIPKNENYKTWKKEISQMEKAFNSFLIYVNIWNYWNSKIFQLFPNDETFVKIYNKIISKVNIQLKKIWWDNKLSEPYTFNKIENFEESLEPLFKSIVWKYNSLSSKDKKISKDEYLLSKEWIEQKKEITKKLEVYREAIKSKTKKEASNEVYKETIKVLNAYSLSQENFDLFSSFLSITNEEAKAWLKQLYRDYLPYSTRKKEGNHQNYYQFVYWDVNPLKRILYEYINKAYQKKNNEEHKDKNVLISKDKKEEKENKDNVVWDNQTDVSIWNILDLSLLEEALILYKQDYSALQELNIYWLDNLIYLYQILFPVQNKDLHEEYINIEEIFENHFNVLNDYIKLIKTNENLLRESSLIEDKQITDTDIKLIEESYTLWELFKADDLRLLQFILKEKEDRLLYPADKLLKVESENYLSVIWYNYQSYEDEKEHLKKISSRIKWLRDIKSKFNNSRIQSIEWDLFRKWLEEIDCKLNSKCDTFLNDVKKLKGWSEFNTYVSNLISLLESDKRNDHTNQEINDTILSLKELSDQFLYFTEKARIIDVWDVVNFWENETKACDEKWWDEDSVRNCKLKAVRHGKFNLSSSYTGSPNGLTWQCVRWANILNKHFNRELESCRYSQNGWDQWATYGWLFHWYYKWMMIWNKWVSRNAVSCSKPIINYNWKIFSNNSDNVPRFCPVLPTVENLKKWDIKNNMIAVVWWPWWSIYWHVVYIGWVDVEKNMVGSAEMNYISNLALGASLNSLTVRQSLVPVTKYKIYFDLDKPFSLEEIRKTFWLDSVADVDNHYIEKFCDNYYSLN